MRTKLITTTSRGLNHESIPYQLYQKAKRFYWDPQKIDFSQDKEDWKRMPDDKKDEILRRVAGFQGGEEAVTVDLLPLIMAIAKEGRLEEEMYLTTFLYEEAKHMEFFNLFLREIGVSTELSHHHSEGYLKLFNEILPHAMNRLLNDQTPEAIAEASTVYNMIVEGVLAETGYYGFIEGLSKDGVMPGLLEGIGYLKMDESRHITYGTYLIQRLICESPHVYDIVMEKMEELAPYASVDPLRDYWKERNETPFGVKFDDIANFSQKQLTVRKEVLARAKSQTMEDIYRNIKKTVEA